MIEKATLSQLPQILKIYEKARKFMSESGNPTQWGTYYPTEEMIRQDILTGKSYVNLKGLYMPQQLPPLGLLRIYSHRLDL